MFKNHLFDILMALAIMVTVGFTIRFASTPTQPLPSSADLSDYSLRHPSAPVSVNAADLSDYFQRHPELTSPTNGASIPSSIQSLPINPGDIARWNAIQDAYTARAASSAAYAYWSAVNESNLARYRSLVDQTSVDFASFLRWKAIQDALSERNLVPSNPVTDSALPSNPSSAQDWNGGWRPGR